jgi:hypothetical protein
LTTGAAEGREKAKSVLWAQKSSKQLAGSEIAGIEVDIKLDSPGAHVEDQD